MIIYHYKEEKLTTIPSWDKTKTQNSELGQLEIELGRIETESERVRTTLRRATREIFATMLLGAKMVNQGMLTNEE